MAKAVTKMKILIITDTNLTQQQAETILSTVTEENVKTRIYIEFKNLLGLDPGLFTKAFKNLRELNIFSSKLTNYRF